MTSHNHLTSSELPDVKIVDIDCALNSLEVSLKFFEIEVFWHRLHNDIHALLNNRSCSKEHDDREHKCTDWINNPPFWPPKNDTSSDDHSDRLDQVTNDMDLSCSLIKVFGLLFGIS